MDYKKVKLEQGMFDDPIKVKWVGGRSVFVAVAIVIMTMAMCAGVDALQTSNDLRQQQLEQARRQYTLDSLKFEYMQRQR